MVKKEFTYRGKTLEELRKMDVQEFSKLVPAKQRRSLKRGFTGAQKALLKKVDMTITKEYKKSIKTHARDMIILPKMIGLTVFIHNGKEFKEILITREMIGHVLGEFAVTRQSIKHSAPGIGATKSSAHQSVK
jgi:small subunit ribosomal protein S19